VYNFDAATRIVLARRAADDALGAAIRPICALSIPPAARSSCGAEGNYNGCCNPEIKGRLRLYLLQSRLDFIKVDHIVPIIDDHVAVEVDPAIDERDIAGGQAAVENFMWLRLHGYRWSGASGAATAMKSADFDPHIVRITVVLVIHTAIGRPVTRGGSFTLAQSSATACVVVVSLRSSVISAQRPLPSRLDLLGIAEGVKRGFFPISCRPSRAIR
jgi:hypothetical protein